MVPEIKPEQDLVQVGQMAELYVMRLMEVTPSPAVLNAQVIELCGFVTCVTKLCFFQWIANGEAGNHGQAVEQPVQQPMVQEIKSEQELVQQLQMAGHAMQLMGVKPSLAVLNAQVMKLDGHNNI